MRGRQPQPQGAQRAYGEKVTPLRFRFSPSRSLFPASLTPDFLDLIQTAREYLGGSQGAKGNAEKEGAQGAKRLKGCNI